MLIADIIDNKPVCPFCKGKTFLSGIRAYEQVMLNNQSLTLFECKCLNCNNDLKYIADIGIKDTKRYKAIGYRKIKKDDNVINNIE